MRQTDITKSPESTNVEPTKPPSYTPKTRGYGTRGRHLTSKSRGRGYKPRGRLHPNMSLVLNKINKQTKKAKLDKQCPFFSRTGLCNRGKSCRYQHDPEKVAICPRFLTGDCPSSAENCLLSHSPTLNRVPPCVHFQNNGRCKNGDKCVYPHVRVGVKHSVCRDFAVLGYCEKGIDCEEAHVRECPDFAETGTCKNPRCKLPHVIRANRKKAVAPDPPKAVDSSTSNETSTDSQQLPVNGVDFTFEGGDEYIPLTFVESDEEEEDGEGEESEDEEVDDEAVDDGQVEDESDMKVFA